MNSGFMMKTEEQQVINKWIAGLGNTNKTGIGIVFWKQGWGKLHMSSSIVGEPLRLDGKTYGWGFGTHADSEIELCATKPLKTFRAWVGVDQNKDSVNGEAEMVFSVWSEGKMLVESQPMKVRSAPERLEVELNGATEFILKIKSQNTVHLGHVDWAEAEAVTNDGETLKVGTPEMAFVAKSLPVSFQYNGTSSEAWFARWGITHTQTGEKDFTTHKYVCSDRDTGLECTLELQEYKHFPACLWNVYFKNTGKTATPILEQVKTLDLNWLATKNKVLRRSRGAFHYEDGGFNAEAFRDDFMMVTDNLVRTPEITMGGVGGRPSVDWMPYFNFEGQDEGLLFGVGWTGQWQAQIKSGVDSVCFQAGMEHLHTVLNPGESIRQPAIMMIYWQGNNYLRGQNLLRRFMTEQIMPHYDGKPLQAPACCPHWGGMIAEHHLDRVKNMIAEKLPYDYFWIDAGWYGKAGPNASEFTPEWGSQAGDWEINRDTYPQGFKEISDTLHADGKKFLLWFEPERAICGTPITLEHPEYFLGDKVKGLNLLLNLGNPAAWKWCTELVAGMIKEQGIDCYRQDFNFSPLPYWQGNDTPDRVGITEIRHVEGLYAFWDELRRRFPNLLIDNCASGGRRLDFEMMRRSIPLWPSDMQCFPEFITERTQQQVHGLSFWIPQFTFGTQSYPRDTYHFRSTMAAGIVAHLYPYEKDLITSEYPYRWLHDRLDEYHRAKVYFAGDFYPLTQQSDSFKDWSVYQFHRPELNSGLLEVFRKKDSDIEKMRFGLCGLDPAATYEVEDGDSKKVITLSGRELMEKGLPVEIENKRDSRLFFYRAATAK